MDVCLSYVDWLAQQQTTLSTLQAVFNDASSVTFCLQTHETLIDTRSESASPNSEEMDVV